jgi:hypothetical protein
MNFLRLFVGAFLMLSALLFRPVEGATHEASQENDSPMKQRQNQDDAAGQKITATIGFKSEVGPSALEALPQGVTILYRYIYIDAIIVEMDMTLVSTLSEDDNIAYVEQDSLAYLTAEVLPWGILAIDAATSTIPAPDPTKPCFKVCVVDSGFSVGHEDLVRTCADPSESLLSFHLSLPDLGLCVAVFAESWEYCWKSVWTPTGPEVGRARADCRSWNSCCRNDRCPEWE